MYVDLNNDAYLTNEKEIPDKEILNGLRAMIPKEGSSERKIEFLNQMAEIEPFSEHPELVEIIRKEIQE